LADLYLESGKKKEAAAHYFKAIELYPSNEIYSSKKHQCYLIDFQLLSELSKKSPNIFLYEQARCYEYFGKIEEDLDRFFEADKLYEKALGIFPKILNQRFFDIAPYYARTLVHQASINDYVRQGIISHEASCKKYEKAIKLYEKISKKDSQTHTPLHAEAYVRYGCYMGNSSAKTAKTKLIENSFKQAILLYEKMEKTNPNAYSEELASVFMLLGLHLKEIHPMKERFDDMESNLIKAIELLNGISGGNEQSHPNDRAVIYRALGELNQSKSALEQTISFYGKEIACLEAIQQGQKTEENIDLAIAYFRLGKMLHELICRQDGEEQELKADYSDIKMQRIAEAIRNLEDGIRFFPEIDESNAKEFGPYIAESYLTMGKLYQKTGKKSLHQASASLAKATQYYEYLTGLDRESMAPRWAETLVLLAHLYESSGETIKVIDHYEKAKVLYEDLSSKNPEEHLALLGDCLCSMGRYCHHKLLNQVNQAEKWYKASLDSYIRLEKHMLSKKNKGNPPMLINARRGAVEVFLEMLDIDPRYRRSKTYKQPVHQMLKELIAHSKKTKHVDQFSEYQDIMKKIK